MSKLKQTFLFFVEFEDGRIHLHHSLTKTQAQKLYKDQDKALDGVRRFGWELEDTSLLSQRVLHNKATITT